MQRRYQQYHGSRSNRNVSAFFFCITVCCRTVFDSQKASVLYFRLWASEVNFASASWFFSLSAYGINEIRFPVLNCASNNAMSSFKLNVLYNALISYIVSKPRPSHFADLRSPARCLQLSYPYSRHYQHFAQHHHQFNFSLIPGAQICISNSVTLSDGPPLT